MAKETPKKPFSEEPSKFSIIALEYLSQVDRALGTWRIFFKESITYSILFGYWAAKVALESLQRSCKKR